MKTLYQAVTDNPFPDYQQWWQMGNTFTHFMANAISAEWSVLPHTAADHVKAYVNEYIQIVYGRAARANLVDQFINRTDPVTIWSGEFDALSYAFFRSAYESITADTTTTHASVETRRRQFTQRVGRKFYQAVHTHLNIQLPKKLDRQEDLEQLQSGIKSVGAFLVSEHYCRDSFQFRFSVDVEFQGTSIHQTAATFIEDLQRNGIAYALYEMGYPVILPSAVYLYNTVGEAQHHSSRTIEELFSRVGYEARETDDFDPTAFPSDKVVELWEIKIAKKSWH